MHQKHWGLPVLLPLLRSERYGKQDTSTDPCGPWRHGLRQMLTCKHRRTVKAISMFLTPYKTFRVVPSRLFSQKKNIPLKPALPSVLRPQQIAFPVLSLFRRRLGRVVTKKLTTTVGRRTEREMTAGAGSDTFAWGLGGDHRDESPTKRRRTATQWYGEDQQQPTDSIPLAGLTRRNRTKTWPSSDASTQQQPTKDSLQLSLSTVAALAKDLNLMEALVLSPHEMEAQRHMVKVPHSQRSMRPLTHPLAQGCPLGPQENPSLLCAKERLHQRSNRVVPAGSRRFQCFLTTLRRSRMTFAAHQRRRERRKRPATTMAVPLLRHWQLPQQAGRRRGGLPPTAHSLPPRAAAPPTRCWRLSRTALTAQHRARGRRLRRTSPPVRHRYLRCTCSRPT